MGNCKPTCCQQESGNKMNHDQINVDITTKSTLLKINGILTSNCKDSHDKSDIKQLYPFINSAFKKLQIPEQNVQKQQDQIMRLPERDNNSVNSSFYKKSYFQIISSRIRTSQISSNKNLDVQAKFNPEVIPDLIPKLNIKFDIDVKQENNKVVQISQAEK